MPPRKNKRENENSENENNKKPRKDPPPIIPPITKIVKFNSLDDALSFLSTINKEPPKKVEENIDVFCKNPLCDHDENNNNIVYPTITTINTLDDLILLGKSFHCKKNLEYRGLNLRLLCNIVPSLNELKLMIGIEQIKIQVINQILFFIQGFNSSTKCNKCTDCTYKLPCPINKNEMLHTIVTGPPGVGKTQFSKILGKIYKGLGILENGRFNEVKRSDLIAKYLGQTSHLTQDAIDKAKGGVLFIDEAYSLGHATKDDMYSKECIDTLTYNLSEKRDFLCIIAGYEDALEKCFFNNNEGLKRRFPFKYSFKEYSYLELLEIFESKVKLSNWKIKYIENNDKEMKNEIINLFKGNIKQMPNQAGDIETIFLQCKIIHSKKLPLNSDKFILTNSDIKDGIDCFIKNKESSDIKDDNWKNMFI